MFYWNAFSFSQLSRVANELPVFVFDRGHLAHAIKPFYPVALSCHFGGWEAPLLDQTRRLDPSALEELAEEQKPTMRAIVARWRSSATPDELVESLAHERAGAGQAEIDT